MGCSAAFLLKTSCQSLVLSFYAGGWAQKLGEDRRRKGMWKRNDLVAHES